MDLLRESRAYQCAVIAVFLALLFAPLVGGLFDIGDDVARIELRKPATAPSLAADWKSIERFPGDLDSYLNDAFGFRSQLVAANSLLHLAIGVSGSQRYMIGRDGWFFQRKVDNILNQARGVDVFTPAELAVWIKEMESSRRWLARQGIEFLIVIAPSKQVIYPEFLPTWANRVGPTRYEQLRAALGRTKLEVVDLHAPLRAAKSAGELLYFKTDGHWNDLGAFVAYREIADWIHARHPDLELLERDDFTLHYEEAATGTITRGLNILSFVTEPIPHLKLRGPSRIESTEVLGSDMRFSATHVSRVRTDRRHGLTVLFVRDSFATPIAHYLSESVYETVATHNRRRGLRREVVTEHKPDLVIFEMVERGLRWSLEPASTR